MLSIAGIVLALVLPQDPPLPAAEPKAPTAYDPLAVAEGDATSLTLAFMPRGRGSFSPGTAKTMVEGMSQGGKVRSHGMITTVPPAYKVRQIPFASATAGASPGDASPAWAPPPAQPQQKPPAKPAPAAKPGPKSPFTPPAFKITIATEGAFPPFNYLDRKGLPAGFEMELAQEACQRISPAFSLWPAALMGSGWRAPDFARSRSGKDKRQPMRAGVPPRPWG
jgi:hypothetical protein